MSRNSAVLWAVLLSGILTGMTLADGLAASRGITVKLKASESAGSADAGSVRLYESSHALVIGIDAYTNGWPGLSYAVEDARAVASELESQGFQVSLKTDLKADAMRTTLREFFAIRGAAPDARLLLWYAGHGHTIRGEGFLVPADAPPATSPAFKVSALPMRDFGSLVRLAESKHVLSVFDSCFSGTVFRARAGAPPAAITRKSTRPVRQFLTSGDAGQQVRDDGSFRKLFVRALRGEDKADFNNDGYVTGDELGLFLSQEMEALTRAAQTPKYGKLHDVDFNQGDFVFVLPGSASDAAMGASGASAEVVFWQSVQASTNPAMFDEFLRQFPSGQFAGLARIKLAEMGGTQTASVTPAPVTTGPAPSDIREAQRLLSGLGYSPGTADGKMGSRTRTAIESFQRSHGLAADGAVTDALMAALKAAQAQVAALRPAPAPRPVPQARPAVGVYARKPGDTFKDCRDCPEMVVIPPGSFRMGDLSGGGNDNEKPVHPVTIDYKFAVGRYEVTRGEFAAFIRESGHRMEDGCWFWNAAEKKVENGSSKNWRNPGFKQTDSDPVVCVNWDDAKTYARWLGRDSGKKYRLLSEAEWEYVARAGSSTKYPFGDSEGLLCEYGNAADRSTGFDWRNKACSDGYGEQTAPVGSFKPNAFGLYDTVGNVWEWTEDCWNGSYSGAPTDGSAWTREDCGRRVRRGGSWYGYPWIVRSAVRSGFGSGGRGSGLGGFRVARLLPRTP